MLSTLLTGTWAIPAVGAIECAVWMLDPFNVHTALNDDGYPMSFSARLISAGINGGIWLALYHAINNRRTKTVMVLAPAACAFTFMQWCFWWWPYFLGDKAGLVEMITQHKHEMRNLPRVLPAIGDHLVPSIEHTILQPLSLLALCQLANALGSLGAAASAEDADIMQYSRLACSLLPTVFLFGSQSPLSEVGPLLACVQIFGTTGYLLSMLKGQ